MANRIALWLIVAATVYTYAVCPMLRAPLPDSIQCFQALDMSGEIDCG